MPAMSGVDVTGLSAEWDSSFEIRDRLRAGGSLIHPSTNDRIVVKTTAVNAAVLEPVLLMMAQSRSAAADDGKSLPSPAVEEIREEIKAVLELNKQEVTFSIIDKPAWIIKKFTAFLKLKVRKRDPSTET